MISLDDLAGAGSDLVDISIKANFRSLGARFGGDVQAIAKAIGVLNAAELVAKVRSHGSADISYGSGASATIEESDLVITETPRTGWAVASHSGESVALDLTLTPELIAQGIVREAIRAIQDKRKESGFDVSDRIDVRWNSAPEYREAIASGATRISEEVLAVSFAKDEALTPSSDELGLALSLSKSVQR